MKLSIPKEARDALAKKDATMKRLIETISPDEMVIEAPFEALVDIIVGQQISEAAQAAIMKRFKEKFGYPDKEKIKQETEDSLKSVGLSSMKAKTILRLAHSDIDFNDLKQQPPEAIRRDLSAIKGIGPWTVDMFFFICLKDPDVLSLHDLGIVNAIKKLYGLEKQEMHALKETFSPYGSYAAAYLWASLRYSDATIEAILKDVKT